MYVCMYVCMMYVCMYVCMYAYMYVCEAMFIKQLKPKLNKNIGLYLTS